ncbi:MAG: helix-turn-helix transcriptional regulator [Carboxylicivirga sp.]|jgi:DNA-binding CsgD family transcriptional regulator|nr:helix-turn-helix transcriptional regulator [Carboxylicivirga sp.]
MKHIKELYRERKKIRSLQSFEVTNKDYERVKPKLELLRRLSDLERSLYSVYDNNRNEFLLQSTDQRMLYEDVTIDKPSGMESHYDYIHPDDLSFVLETDNLTPHVFSQFDRDEQMHIKVVYDFRIKNAANSYSRYMHQIMILEQDRLKNPWLILVISSLISDKSNNEKPNRQAINIKTKKVYSFDDTENVTSLTSRESEILLLIMQGYDNYGIASKLHISLNTINNHRRNIIQKTNTNNITNAMAYCKRLGLI